MTTALVGNGIPLSLEELVGRLMDALRWERAPSQASGIPGRIHEARRCRQASDLDGALEALASADMPRATAPEGRWAYSEWLHLIRLRFGAGGVAVYSPSVGRAAALVSREDGTLEVVAVLAMAWQPGKRVSHRSLGGLRSLKGGRPW